MRDRITANVPAVNPDETANCYDALGLDTKFRDEQWMVASREDLEVEFFPHPTLQPSTSWFSACAGGL